MNLHILHAQGMAIDAMTARVKWTRGGSKGTRAIMYKIEYKVISPASSSTKAAQRDGMAGDTWTQAQLVAAKGIAVGRSESSWRIESSTDLRALSARPGCCDVCASTPRGRSAVGTLVDGCSHLGGNQYSCIVRLLSQTGAGLQYGESLYPAQSGDTILFLFSQAQSISGTPLEPQTAGNITAEIGMLDPDTEYLVRVRSANFNQGGFESRGSNLASILTVGRPPRVTTLSALYMSGDNGVQLAWDEIQGGSYCGNVVYRLFRQTFVDGEYSAVWGAAHAGYITQAPQSEGIFSNLTTSSNGSVAISKAKFVVCSYCQAHLPGEPRHVMAIGYWTSFCVLALAHPTFHVAPTLHTITCPIARGLGVFSGLSPLAHTLPFLEDTAGGHGSTQNLGAIEPWCPLGNIIEVTSTPRPKDDVKNVQVVGVSENSVRLTWQPVQHADRYKVLISHRIPNSSALSCSEAVSSSWSDWYAYSFPLGDYPGKGGGAGESVGDALFASPEAFLFAPSGGWQVSASCGRRFKVLGGSPHGVGQGSFPCESRPTAEYWLRAPAPYLSSSLIHKTRVSAHVGWSFYPRSRNDTGRCKANSNVRQRCFVIGANVSMR